MVEKASVAPELPHTGEKKHPIICTRCRNASWSGLVWFEKREVK